MGRKSRYRTVTVEVEVDDVLDDLDDTDVIEEAKERGLVCYRPAGQEGVEDIRRAILKRDWAVAITLLDRHFKDPNASAKADYEAWKLQRDEELRNAQQKINPVTQGSDHAEH